MVIQKFIKEDYTVRDQSVMEMMDLMLVMSNQFAHLFELQEKCMVNRQLIKEKYVVRDQHIMNFIHLYLL